MVFDGRMNIVDIDDDEKVVYFDTFRTRKISGTKIGGILGYSEFATPFKVALEIAAIYPGDRANRYIDAGNYLEPVLRKHLSDNADAMLRDILKTEGKITVEEPVEKELCRYDHFPDDPLFGGMVDGFIKVDGERRAILEIKTSHEISKWLDEDGKVTKVPMSYILQACLYAELAHLDDVVFMVGFLTESEVTHPNLWKPTPENTYLIPMKKIDMKPYMDECREWYKEYIDNGYTPEWDDEKDADVLKYIRTKPGKRR